MSLSCYTQRCVDIDEFIAASNVQQPHIVATESDENVEYHIYIESECLITVNSVADILADLICAYFGSNIAYPNSLYPILILLQRFVLGIKDSQKISVIPCHLFVLHKTKFVDVFYNVNISYIFGTNKSKFIVKLLARPMFVITPWRSNRLVAMTLQRSCHDVTG